MKRGDPLTPEFVASVWQDLSPAERQNIRFSIFPARVYDRAREQGVDELALKLALQEQAQR